jgi:hypothetical protein
MAWVTERYEQVPLTAHKNLPCPACGKKVRRQRTFTETINPFRRDLTPGMSSTEVFQVVMKSLQAKADEWAKKPVLCTPCEDGEA